MPVHLTLPHPSAEAETDVKECSHQGKGWADQFAQNLRSPEVLRSQPEVGKDASRQDYVRGKPPPLMQLIEGHRLPTLRGLLPLLVSLLGVAPNAFLHQGVCEVPSASILRS